MSKMTKNVSQVNLEVSIVKKGTKSVKNNPEDKKKVLTVKRGMKNVKHSQEIEKEAMNAKKETKSVKQKQKLIVVREGKIVKVMKSARRSIMRKGRILNVMEKNVKMNSENIREKTTVMKKTKNVEMNLMRNGKKIVRKMTTAHIGLKVL